MKLLHPNLKYILPKIEKAPRLILFLDYDGTLTPIVNKPAQAILSNKTKLILKKLSRNKRITLSIVSGRSLFQIKKLVGLSHIYYAGCHGLEIALSERSHVVPEAQRASLPLRILKRALSGELKTIRFAEVEDKGMGLAVHYRRVKKSQVRKVEEIFSKVTAAYLKSKRIKVAKGKKVLEIRPPVEWNKGRYCLYLLNKLKRPGERLLPVYIGDDLTDEDAFRALRKKGVTIFVKGERKSSQAEYYLNSTAEVRDFLEKLTLVIAGPKGAKQSQKRRL